MQLIHTNCRDILQGFKQPFLTLFLLIGYKYMHLLKKSLRIEIWAICERIACNLYNVNCADLFIIPGCIYS